MKRFILMVAILLSIVPLAACSNFDLELEKSQLQSDVKTLQKEVDTLQEEIDTLKAEIDTLQKTKNGLLSEDSVVYIIELEISQTHVTGDVKEHFKDSMNKMTIPLQVSEQYYHSIEVGDVLNNELRVGSLLYKGSLGHWNVKIINKQTVIITE